MKLGAIKPILLLWAGSCIAGVIAGAFQGTVSPGTAHLSNTQELVHLKSLLQANQFHALLAAIETDYPMSERCAIRPQLLFLEWAAYLAVGKPQIANAVAQTLYQEFPKSQFAPYIHFDYALQSVAKGDYADARQQLQILSDQYPDSAQSLDAKHILQELSKGAVLLAPSKK